MPEKKKISVLSFFSGGGFMDMGFIKAGFNIAWTNEFDATFATLYSEGMASWIKHRDKSGTVKKSNISNLKSIKEIDADDILQEAFKGQVPPEFGIIGGPPCQDFSLNGNLNGFQGERGSLTDAYLYKVLELQPAFFVMENVTGLIKVKKNAKHFLELLKAMEDDYCIDWDVLNSIDFGVPQSRDRIFVIGINKTKYATENIKRGITGCWFPFKKHVLFPAAQTSFKWPGANPFGGNVEKPTDIPEQLFLQNCLVSEEEEKSIPNAKEYFNLKGDPKRFNTIQEGETNRPSFKRLHRYKYSPTACYGNNEVHLHPFLCRRLSVREALRIQGVEDSYVLTTKGMLSKKFKMIGNGVPVPLAEGLARALQDFLSELPKKE